MIMQEKEPGTYEKTGIPDPVIPGKTCLLYTSRCV